MSPDLGIFQARPLIRATGGVYDGVVGTCITMPIILDMTLWEKFWTVMDLPRNVGPNSLDLIGVGQKYCNPLSSYLKARPPRQGSAISLLGLSRPSLLLATPELETDGRVPAFM